MLKTNHHFLLVLVLLSPGLTTSVSAQSPMLGSIEFPTSGSAEAQDDFIRGMLLLHSFEFEDAATAFHQARSIDSTFGMAYWGEAMSHNHPLWAEQDSAAATDALNELAPNYEARKPFFPTEKERAFQHAVETLYGTTEMSRGKSKEERDDLYMDEMRRMYEMFPNDQEVATLYALSILGTAHEGRDFATYMHAASIAMKVWDENRLHPGAAHYLIHSFDDPVHARLGLPMARAYSEIAPAAAHAQHMTSHIFVALGMWDDVVAANEVASRVSNERLEKLERPLNVCGHYPFWLEYGYLEQDRINDAKSLLDACYARMAEDPRQGERWYFGSMLARFVVDAQYYDIADEYDFVYEEGDDAGASYHFAQAFAAARMGRITDAISHQLKIAEHAEEDDRIAQILSAQIGGILALHNGEIDNAIEILSTAAEMEAALPIDFGPPDPAKPSYELLGESLVELGRPAEANAAFRTQLKRTIDRTASLSGLAVTAEQMGDTATAAEAMRRLDSIRNVNMEE